MLTFIYVTITIYYCEIERRHTSLIFLCFSVKDRIPLINDFYHFLSNFGLDIWYDRRNIYLGDNRREKNISYGAENPDVDYAVVFYSNNFKSGNICLEEFDILVERYYKGEVFLFPVFLSEVPQKIDQKFQLCKTLVYKHIHDQSDFNALALHIIAKITSDEICNTKFKSIRDIELNYGDKTSIYYKLVTEYQNIKKTNYNMRIASLYSLYLIVSHTHNLNFFHNKTMNFIYHQNCLDILINEKRELQIMENIICYTLSVL